MGWKTFKEHYGIDYKVTVGREKKYGNVDCIFIGSASKNGAHQQMIAFLLSSARNETYKNMNSRQQRKYQRNCDKLAVWFRRWKPTLKSTSRELNIRRKAIKHIDSERRICCKDGAGCRNFDDCIYALPF